jgi:hypothetical protein
MTTTRHHAYPRLAWAALALAICSAGTACAQQRANPEMRAEAQALAQSCRPDYQRHCSGVRPGGGRVLACLRGQDPQQLSPACREALPKAATLQSRATAAGTMPR